MQGDARIALRDISGTLGEGFYHRGHRGHRGVRKVFTTEATGGDARGRANRAAGHLRHVGGRLLPQGAQRSQRSPQSFYHRSHGWRCKGTRESRCGTSPARWGKAFTTGGTEVTEEFAKFLPQRPGVDTQRDARIALRNISGKFGERLYHRGAQGSQGTSQSF